jgi:hypothetical protein
MGRQSERGLHEAHLLFFFLAPPPSTLSLALPQQAQTCSNGKMEKLDAGCT